MFSNVGFNEINSAIVTNLPWLPSHEEEREILESSPRFSEVKQKSDGQNEEEETFVSDTPAGWNLGNENEEEEYSVSGTTLGCCNPGNAHCIAFFLFSFISSSSVLSDSFGFGRVKSFSKASTKCFTFPESGALFLASSSNLSLLLLIVELPICPDFSLSQEYWVSDPSLSSISRFWAAKWFSISSSSNSVIAL